MKSLSLLVVWSVPLWFVGGFASSASAQPAGWRCDPAQYGDDVCDCGCGIPDSDCADGRFVVCDRNGCTRGQVPWEHEPSSCMSSACGDGWKDEARGEQCDDGEGLAGGGCNRDCSAVNEGWICGERADQCERGVAVMDAGAPDAGGADSGVGAPDSGAPDAGTPDAGAPDAGADASVMITDSSGCSAAHSGSGGLPLAGFALALFAARRRRSLARA